MKILNNVITFLKLFIYNIYKHLKDGEKLSLFINDMIQYLKKSTRSTESLWFSHITVLPHNNKNQLGHILKILFPIATRKPERFFSDRRNGYLCGEGTTVRSAKTECPFRVWRPEGCTTSEKQPSRNDWHIHMWLQSIMTSRQLDHKLLVHIKELTNVSFLKNATV